MAISPEVYEAYKFALPNNPEYAIKLIDSHLKCGQIETFPTVKLKSQMSYADRCKVAEEYLYAGWALVAHITSSEIWDSKKDYTQFFFVSEDKLNLWRRLNNNDEYNTAILNSSGITVFRKMKIQ